MFARNLEDSTDVRTPALLVACILNWTELDIRIAAELHTQTPRGNFVITEHVEPRRKGSLGSHVHDYNMDA